ncbi:NF-kappa-B inhibitor cactus [Agrilus planipennis]|uniref:NF-kappa-B inhibitor cactus n=1 Tax=Agrilus planipennis TaxID=224129 RepID=A0A1W4XPZ7_AGRPL|nr:NF-kappa-B inhibitor cactus [Agrilus planipennis]
MPRSELFMINIQHLTNDFPRKTAPGMTEDEKTDCDSRTDSGFLSGGNLALSGEIISEEIPPTPTSADDHKKQALIDDNLMRLDSGVDLGLSESFSSLSLKNSGLNDLSSGNIDESQPCIKESDQKEIPWELYFEQDEDGDTHLHIAIVQRFPEVVLALIRAAPHPRLLDTPNDDALTPLHLAVVTGQWHIVRWLIVAGARPGPRNLRGDSPLHICAQTGDLQTCKAITNPVTQHERDSLALSYPAQPYHQVDLEQWNYDGQTCVHVAAINGHVDVLRHLVWYGADINAREGRSGYTALHYAIENRDERLTTFLLECNKINASVVTYGGRSVLQLGFPVPSNLFDALRSRGVPSPYSSDEEYDSSSSEDEAPYKNTNVCPAVKATA